MKTPAQSALLAIGTTSQRNRPRLGLFRNLSVAVGLILVPQAQSQVAGGPPNLLPVDCGESVVTCYSGQNATGVNAAGFVVGIIDVRNPAGNGAVLNTNWAAPMYHNEYGGAANVWNAANLGQVFGITLDRAAKPNIYVSATSIYGMNSPAPTNYAAGGPGAVYKLDGITGAISTFAVLPNAFNSNGRAPALGNICFDRKRNQFFVSNFEDGLIYRLDMTGAWLSSVPYDHGKNARPNVSPLAPILDDGIKGNLTALGRRVWGLNVFDNRLYYGVWNEDRANPSTTVSNEIWSAGLDAGGLPDAGTARLEITLPAFFNTLAGSAGAGTLMSFSSPVSDITFTDGGRMLVAERTVPFFAHQSRVLEFDLNLSTGTWQPNTKEFRIGGAAAPDSSAGGVDYTCDSDVWATGDYMQPPNGQLIYGMTYIPSAGNSLATITSSSYLIDFNGIFNAGDDKSQQGDVVINRQCCECVQICDVSVHCQPLPAPQVGTASQWTFQVVNTMPWTISHITFLQTPGFTVTPGPIYTLPTPLLPGNATNITVTPTPTSQPAPDHACMRMIFHSPVLDQCCEIVHCVELDECCAEVTNLCLHPDPASPTGWTLCFNYTNLAPNSVSWIFVVPAAGYQGCIQPFIVPVFPALATGQTGSFCQPVTVDPACKKICMIISGHSANFQKCCSVTGCVEVHCPCIPKTWTLDADFDLGTVINLNHNPNHDQLQLNPITKPLPFVCIPCSARGTVVRIDINGPNSPAAVMGEYWSSPDSFAPGTSGRDPSRTTVDKYGNVWVGNRASYEKLDGTPPSGPADSYGSVVRIGIVLGGTRGDVVAGNFTPNPLGSYLKPPFTYSTCTDRDGDGYIKTSRGLGHILPWNNAGGVDTDGGVQTAEDECITIYTRVPGGGTRFLAVDCNNNLWTGGLNDQDFQAVDGVTGNLIGGTYFNVGAGGYGGLLDGFGVLWGGSQLMRVNSSTLVSLPVQNSPYTYVYGLGIDPRCCHVFGAGAVSYDSSWNTVASGIIEFDTSGNILFDYPTQGGATGICVDGTGNVWAANGTQVYHLSPNSPLCTGHTVQPPVTIPVSPNPVSPGSIHVRGVAVDSNGHIWAADLGGNSAHRINSGSATVDKTIDLGSSGTHPTGLNASPYNYSDMTGFVALGSTCREGSWSVLHDGGCDGLDWGTLTWTGSNLSASNQLIVEIRADDQQPLLPTHPFITVANGQKFCNKGITGRWVEIRVRFIGAPCSTESPILKDITLTCCEGHDDPCSDEDHPPTAIKCPDSVAVCPDKGATTSTVTLSAMLSDSDGGPINVRWKEGTTILSNATIAASGPPTVGTTTLTQNFPIGNHLITLCAQVGGSWVAICEAKVKVGDQDAPKFVCPPGITVVGWQGVVPNFLGNLQATDDCTPATLLVATQSPAAGTAVGTGTHIITIVVADAAGHSTTCETTYIVSPDVALVEPANYAFFNVGQPIRATARTKSAEPATQFAFIVNGLVMGQTPGNGGQGSVQLPILPPGAYTISVVASGPGGQRSSVVRPRQFTVGGDGTIIPTLAPCLEIRGNNIAICVPTVLGENCTVESSPDLDIWTEVPNGTFTGTGFIREIILPLAPPPADKYFYRVRRAIP